MTIRCWKVEVAHERKPGVFDHAYVAAEDETEAMRLGAEKSGHPARMAKVAFPWLAPLKGDIAPDPSDTVAEVEDGRRESDGSIGVKHPRTAEVLEWLHNYAGRNEFVLDVQHKVKNGRVANGRNVGQRKAYRLSKAQVEALAKVKDREAEWAKARVERPKSGLNLWAVLPYGTTYACAENERGTLSFVKMDKVERGKWADWVFVKAVIGGNEDMRLGSQRPDSDDYSGQWTEVLRNVCADVVGAVARYGLELGVCGVCNRQLTNDESRRLGIGPVCLSRLNRGA